MITTDKHKDAHTYRAANYYAGIGIKEQKIRMNREWRPSKDAYDALASYGVPINFCHDEVAPFVLEWEKLDLHLLPFFCPLKARSF